MTAPIVKRYLIALDRYKWIGLASFVLVVAGSVVVAVQPDPKPTYTASGALTYTRPPVSFSATGTLIQTQGQDLNEDSLLSDQIVEPLATKVNVKSKTLVENLLVTLPRKDAKTGQISSSLIEVKYKDSDPKRAAQVVQTLMQAMVDQSSMINTGRLKEIIKKINDRLPAAKKELEAAEQRLELYDRTQGPALIAAQNGSLLQSISGSQNQQQQIKLTLSGIDAQIRSLQTKLGLTVNQAYTSSALSADPIIANLRSQLYQIDSQYQLLRKDLRPEHPRMIELQRQKESAEQLLQQRASEVIGGSGGTAPLPSINPNSNLKAIRAQSNLDPARQQLANNLGALQTQRETLQQQLVNLVQAEQKYRQEYTTIPNKQLERTRLEQQVVLKKSLFDQVQIKLVDAKAAEAETVSSLAVAKPPIVIADIKPPKSIPITLAIGTFMGLIIGGGVVFLLGSMEGILKTMEDIRDSLRQREVPILGILPLMPVWDLDRGQIPVIFSTNSPYLEFYERFRSNLRRVSGRNLKVILITSTSSNEGKTVSAYNLGIASARAGKRTLIVETDLRSPTHCQSLKVTPDTEAFAEPLHYYGSLSECIRLVPEVENLYIVPSPGPVRQAAAILESSEMRRLMEDVRGRFDIVILDTSPLSLSNDALLIQPYSDGILLVTRPNYTEDNLLGEAIDQLNESELPILGGIINGADIAVALPPMIEATPEEETVTRR